jgi:hypothetical protein
MAPSLLERLRRMTAACDHRQQQQQQQQQPGGAASAAAAKAAGGGIGAAAQEGQSKGVVFALGASSASGGAYRWPDANDYSSAEAHPHARHPRARPLDELPAAPRQPVNIPPALLLGRAAGRDPKYLLTTSRARPPAAALGAGAPGSAAAAAACCPAAPAR